MLLFTGVCRVVDSRSDYRVKLINFKFTAAMWVSSNNINIINNSIKQIYNPKNISVDDAVEWLLNNTPYSSKQTKAKTIKVRNHLELLQTNIDTDVEGEYEE